MNKFLAVGVGVAVGTVFLAPMAVQMSGVQQAEGFGADDVVIIAAISLAVIGSLKFL